MRIVPKRDWNPVAGGGRIASLLRFVVAIAWFEVADHLAALAARGLAPLAGGEDVFELIHRSLLLFLLVIGFGYMGLAFDHQAQPLRAMGLQPRQGWLREVGVGAALGWGAALAVVVLIALAAMLRIEFWTEPRAFWLLIIDLLALAVGSLGIEVALRGYAFQRLVEAVGPTLATLLMACFAGIVLWTPSGATGGATGIAVLASMLGTIFLSIAYLRTRALWLPWGAHLAWNLSMGVLFGLPLGGVLNYATVVQGRALGPVWLTGGSYGPEGSVATVVVLTAAIVVLVFATRDYAWRYAQPVIVAGGMAVDVAPPAAHAAMEAAAAPLAGTTLVQIAGAAVMPKQDEKPL